MSFRGTLQRYAEWAGHGLLTPLRLVVEHLLRRHGLVFLYRAYGSGLGDTLAMTTVLNAFNRQMPTRAIVFSKVPALFHAHPQVVRNLDYQQLPKLARSLLKSLAKYLRGSRVIHIGREKWLLGTWPWQTTGQDHEKSWLEQMVPDLPRTGVTLVGATPEIHFAADELECFGRKFAHLPERYAVVKSSVGANRPSGMAIKNWSVAGFQHVVDATRLPWVQLGDAAEPGLNNVVSLLGQTSLREALYVLSRASLVLTVEGFISHAAAAFHMPIVVVYSGFHDAGNLCYPTTVPVVAPVLPPCAPCYLPIDGVCLTPGKPCTAAITPEQVTAAVRSALPSA